MLTFRFAQRKDVGLILRFIRELADYEHMLSEVVANEENISDWLFDKQRAQVIFIVKDGKEIGFALFYHNFSTILGRSGLYIEDLYIIPKERGKGYGTQTLRYLAQLALERSCGRMEWCCVDWNTPSIEFYLSLGARQMSEWTTYRLSGTTLKKLAWGE